MPPISSVTFSGIVLQNISIFWSCVNVYKTNSVCSCTLALGCPVWKRISFTVSWKPQFDLGGHLGDVKSIIHPRNRNSQRNEKDFPETSWQQHNPKQKYSNRPQTVWFITSALPQITTISTESAPLGPTNNYFMSISNFFLGFHLQECALLLKCAWEKLDNTGSCIVHFLICLIPASH